MTDRIDKIINVVQGRLRNGKEAIRQQRGIAAARGKMPRPGDGITIHQGTDKAPGTIVRVNWHGTRLWYTEDTVQWRHGSTHFVTVPPDTRNERSAFWYTPPRDRAGWRKVGEPNTRITIGERRYEQDPI